MHRIMSKKSKEPMPVFLRVFTLDIINLIRFGSRIFGLRSTILAHLSWVCSGISPDDDMIYLAQFNLPHKRIILEDKYTTHQRTRSPSAPR